MNTIQFQGPSLLISVVYFESPARLFYRVLFMQSYLHLSSSNHFLSRLWHHPLVQSSLLRSHLPRSNQCTIVRCLVEGSSPGMQLSAQSQCLGSKPKGSGTHRLHGSNSLSGHLMLLFHARWNTLSLSSGKIINS